MLRFGAAAILGIAFSTSLLGFSPASAITMKDVRSHMYMIATAPQVAGTEEAIGASNTDLIIMGGSEPRPPINRSIADPTNSKIIISYIDVTEFFVGYSPTLAVNNQPPAYLVGTEHPAFPNLFSVKYWLPEWKTEMFRQIDKVIAANFDGIFLDLPFGDWETNNTRNNIPHATAAEDLITLVGEMKAYIAAKNLGRPFYLVGNSPLLLSFQFPNALKATQGITPLLDAWFNEGQIMEHLPTDGTKSRRTSGAERNIAYLRTHAATTLKDIPVLGNDYTVDVDLATETAQWYSAIGWIPSVTNGKQDAAVYGTGPFISIAVAAKPETSARSGYTNILAGGLVAHATMTGADKGDIFIGGKFRNTMTGGAGNDTFYAHPIDVVKKNTLTFEVAGSGRNLPVPVLTVKLNGRVVYSAAPTVEPTTNEWNKVEIDTTRYEPVTSVEFSGTNIKSVDQNTFSNLFVRAFKHQNTTITFTGAVNTGNVISQDGGATLFLNSEGAKSLLGAPTFPIAAPVFSEAVSTINGGAGTNTVVYRANKSNYTITANADGSLNVISARTAEGPDTLRNVQVIKFADQTVTLPSATSRVFGPVFSSASTTSQSFLRVNNTGVVAGTVTAQLRNPGTGAVLGTWTSPSIPAGASSQFLINVIESALPAGTPKPVTYTVTLSGVLAGSTQHVLYRPADGTLTNLSTCEANVTANGRELINVHSSLLDYGFPSTVVVSNTGTGAAQAVLGVYDSLDGQKLGTYTTPAIAPNAQARLSIAAIQNAAGITPNASQYHYNILVENAFSGYLQHQVNNLSVGVVTDMTTTCGLSTALDAPSATPTVGSVFSSAQAASQSFLRFHNTGATAGGAALTIFDASTGAALAQWNTGSVAAGASAQFLINTIEAGATAQFTKPQFYNMVITPNMSGYVQHVLYRPADGTLTNLSTCNAGITANPRELINVHSTILDSGFPSSVVLNNLLDTAEPSVTLGIYDSTNGQKLGTYTSGAVPAKGSLSIAVATIEAATGIKPGTSIYHYNVKVESQLSGFMQHLVNNKAKGVVTDMTTTCRLN
jgi:endo-alpha-1,4-polygalactosaminidase (GH114 family)